MVFRLLLILLPILVSGCNSSLLVQPEIIPGGINSNSTEEHPTYSSNGRYLAFASDRRNHRDIFLYDLEQRQLVSLPNLNRRDSSQDQPALNADGRYIVYVSTERGRTDIFVYDRNLQRSELLTANIKGSVANPTINGDGSQIAFQSSQLGKWKINIISRDVEDISSNSKSESIDF